VKIPISGGTASGNGEQKQIGSTGAAAGTK